MFLAIHTTICDQDTVDVQPHPAFQATETRINALSAAFVFVFRFTYSWAAEMVEEEAKGLV